MPKSQKVKLRQRVLVHVRCVIVRLARDTNVDLHDTNYVLRRLQSEGLRFVTKVLPLFVKYVLACLENKSILPAKDCGLTHFDTVGGAPRFMRGLLFEALKGSASALLSIRQFCEYFYKMSFDFEREILASAESKYVSTEENIRNEPIERSWAEKARKAFETLFPQCASAHPHDILSCGPHDGPGAFVGSERLHTPYEVYKKLPSRSIGSHHSVYGAYSGYFRSYRTSREAGKEGLVGVDEAKVAKVLFVPKDARGPRTISKEPLMLMKGQMAYNTFLSKALERESHGRVMFSSQEKHKALARQASIDGKQATLDLKDASDRVRLDVVRTLFRNSPGNRWFLNNTRTTHCQLPSGKTLELKKFANMGSGLCFPVLALVVYIAAVLGIQSSQRCSLKSAALQAYVFGDDLIIPTDCYQAVVTSLGRLGLSVNTDKSFYRGQFRESCGGDYYNGIAVGPVRLRLSNGGLPTINLCRNGVIPITTDAGLVQLERHCRELVDNHLQQVADYYYSRLERRLGTRKSYVFESGKLIEKYVLPLVGRESNALGRYSPGSVSFAEVEAFVPVSERVFDDKVCPYKGIGRALRAASGLGEDWCLTPLRRSVKLKRRVLSPAATVGYGLSEPDWNLASLRS